MGIEENQETKPEPVFEFIAGAVSFIIVVIVWGIITALILEFAYQVATGVELSERHAMQFVIGVAVAIVVYLNEHIHRHPGEIKITLTSSEKEGDEN